MKKGSPAGIGRRAFLTSVGLGFTSTAGCTSSPDDPRDAGSATPSTPDRYRSGGRPIIGLTKSPNTLNPLAGGNGFLVNLLYTYGTINHPVRSEFVPWAFEDWSLKVQNIGTASPTVIGHLRDDITFSDGRSLTAQDVKFTVDYVTEQSVTGLSAASQFERVESVQVDAPNGQVVSYFLSEPDAGWLSRLLGQLIIPRHVWKDVADYQQYAPLHEPEGIVGSGPFVVRNANLGEWIELSLRQADEVWQTSVPEARWFHDEAPFIDGIRFPIFGDTEELRRSVMEGDIDASVEAVPVDQAVKAKNTAGLKVIESQTAGWHQHAYNLRRVPFDDRAFRQFLVKLVDKRWVVEELDRGIGSIRGSYAMPPSRVGWRPPAPEHQPSIQGIPTPDLQYPGQPGSFELPPAGIEAARSFLSEHPDSNYTYSWEPVENRDVPVTGGKLLHIDGTPFGGAHTDNGGADGAGPLAVSFNPPGDDPDESRIASQWIANLRAVGIPTEARVQSFESQLVEVFQREDFDVCSINWTNVPADNTYFQQLFGHWGADAGGSVDVPMMNPMGYTAADEIISAQRSTMNRAERAQLVQQLLAKLWNDAPVNVIKHDVRLQPVNRDWEGWVETPAFGAVNLYSLLNLRRRVGAD